MTTTSPSSTPALEDEVRQRAIWLFERYPNAKRAFVLCDRDVKHPSLITAVHDGDALVLFDMPIAPEKYDYPLLHSLLDQFGETTQ